jgi:hypothetical protein
MNWNPIDRQWHRVRARLKSTYEILLAFAEGWLAKLKLKDHYGERRASS